MRGFELRVNTKQKAAANQTPSSDYKQKLKLEMLLSTELQQGAFQIMLQPGHRVSESALPNKTRLRPKYQVSVKKNSPTFPKNK